MRLRPPPACNLRLVAQVTRQQVTRQPGTKRQPKEQAPSERLPVARVAVDISLAHLDRPFDYLVPARYDEQAVPGCRVRVRFAGQLVDGYLLERAETTEHQGRLAYLDRVVSPEPVLSAEIAGLARAVADRYAGTLADVLRLAIPPRHASTEKEQSRCYEQGLIEPDRGSWQRYPAGQAFLHALAERRPVRAAWSALPGPRWPAEIAAAAATTAAAGRGTLIVVPDARDLARVGEALSAVELAHVTLTADLGPAERYRRWLAVRRGAVTTVVGTRAAMFAPVANLGLVVLWDDGDDLHAEPRAPYPHAREVLALRAHRTKTAALIGGFARTTELTQLVANGWARELAPDPQQLRRAQPRIAAAWGSVTDDNELARDAAALSARLPSLALRTARDALRGEAAGPVLVQVPRRGYLASFACDRCRAQARCEVCRGPLRISGSGEIPGCGWCGALAAGWTCQNCGGTRIRALVTGAARTAEELGRAFPSIPVRTSGGAQVLAVVPDEPALVIATPGAEPVAERGYSAGLLLDGWALLGRPSLRAAEETLRRWLNAAALIRPAAPVVVLAESQLPAVQALIGWNPIIFAERELAERTELGFPPAVRMAAVSGPAAVLADFLATLGTVGGLAVGGLAVGAEVLGPVPVVSAASAPDAPADIERALIRVDRAHGLDLARALHAAQAGRSARKEGGVLRVELDPAEVV
jgi:primosomal protein N' (replication factor Y) (superfamily II helicase)